MKNNINTVFDLSKKVAEHLESKHGFKISVRLETHKNEPGMVIIDECIDIVETTIKRETIADTIDVPGYLLEVCVPFNNYPHEPDDVNIQEVSETEYIPTAIKNAFSLYLENKLEHIIENISYEPNDFEDFCQPDGYTGPYTEQQVRI